MSKQASLITLGCAKNLVDSEYLITGLKHVGYKINSNTSDSDVVIINTCGFLDIAREESIDKIVEIDELKQQGVIDKVIVMGCLSERYGDELQKELPNVDKFFGSEEHEAVIKYLSGKSFNLDDPDIIRLETLRAKINEDKEIGLSDWSYLRQGKEELFTSTFPEGKDLSDIIVKLIDRHNVADNSADRRQEQVIDKIDSLEREVCDLKERISYLQGRINGK